MPFPVSPAIGDTHVEFNTTWTYGNTGWYRSIIGTSNETLYTCGPSLGSLNDVDLDPPPSNGDALVYDSASDTWIPGAGGGSATPAGIGGDIQINDGGSPANLGVVSGFNYDDVTDVLSIPGDINLDDGGTFTTTLQTVTPTANRTISLPDATGTVGLVAGSSGQVTYNNAGVQAGSSSLTFDGFRLLASALGYFNRRPALHRGPLFTKPTSTTLSVVAGAVLNGVVYSTATAVTMPAHTNNVDYAIWQNPTTGALVGDASFTTAPAGATGGSIVGGYHYIPSGRPTAFNNGSPTAAAEILEYSIWDLTWRPECPDPRGMANIDGRFWCDLYLCGATSYAGTDFSAVPSSKIGLTIADDSSPALIPGFYGGDGSTAYALLSGNSPGSWYNFAEVAHSFGKRLMWSWEFQAAAFGAPEAGSRGTDPGTVIWERASKWGLAQATGTLWVWGAEHVITVDSGVNPITGGRGTVNGTPRAVILGGAWNNGSTSGSRGALWHNLPSNGYFSSVGGRFAAGHLTLG